MKSLVAEAQNALVVGNVTLVPGSRFTFDHHSEPKVQYYMHYLENGIVHYSGGDEIYYSKHKSTVIDFERCRVTLV